MNFQEIETATFKSWPAFEELLFDGWLIRYAKGYTKRSNSVNIVSPINSNLSHRIRKCEDFYKKRNLPCIFRIPSFNDTNVLDNTLNTRGYALGEKSLVLYQPLQNGKFNTVNLVEKSFETWIDSFYRISGKPIVNKVVHSEVLKRIEGNLHMVVIVESGEEVSCGIGVIYNGYYGIFDIATKQTEQNKGYGTKLLGAMINWAVKNGATKAYVQVVIENTPAIKLYRKMGYRSGYSYWYRMQY